MSVEIPKLEVAETSRTYTFPGGDKIEIRGVTNLLVRPSGNHRLISSDGKLHIVPFGWNHLEILAPYFSV